MLKLRRRNPRLRKAGVKKQVHNKVGMTIEGRELTLSNLDKVLYQRNSFTKKAVIDYYIRIAPVLLPYLANRPITLKRYPDGSLGHFFYQKQCPVHRPKWLATAPVWSSHNQKEMQYCLINDLASLVWAANLASLELHTSLSIASKLDKPQTVVFDLDPGYPANIIDCTQVALWLKEIFDKLNLKIFAKTSGSKGLQVYLPLNSSVTYEQTKRFAHDIAKILEKNYPEKIVSKMNKNLRKGKVFVDWSQNDEHKTTVSVYSLRAQEMPTVSTPITWEEVAAAYQYKDRNKLYFTAEDVLRRVGEKGDVFSQVLSISQQIPNLKT